MTSQTEETVRNIMRKTNERGLTLLEILIASLILVSIVLSLANIYAVGKRYVVHTRARIHSAEIGKYFLEPLYIQVRQDEYALGNNCLSSDPTAGCPGAQVIDNITYTPTWNITDVPATTLRSVSVTVNWTEP